MPARCLPPEGLPHWPRWLTAEFAAAYLGVSVDRFHDEIALGFWPDKHPHLERWDRTLLDQAVDRIDSSMRAVLAHYRKKSAEDPASD